MVIWCENGMTGPDRRGATSLDRYGMTGPDRRGAEVPVRRNASPGGGTVYGSVFTRVSAGGKLVGVVKYKDADGTWRQRSKTFSADEAESRVAFDEWLASIGAAGEDPTVGKLVLDALATDLERGLIERSTYETQAGYARNHILPALGDAPARGLTPSDVESWARSLPPGLSPASARVAWNVLRKALARAARDGLIPASPMEGVAPPRAARPRPAHLDARARAELLAAARREWGAGSGRACAVALGLFAGLRCGECCALRWRDVEGGRVRVRQAVGRSTGGGYLKAPKSAASTRDFPAPAQLAEALAERAACAGVPPDPSWFVCGEGPAFAEPRALSNAFARLCERAGIVDNMGKRATFHTLRHTFATVAVAAGVDVKTLSTMLGHASAKVTLDVYASADEDAKRAGIARVEEAFG